LIAKHLIFLNFFIGLRNSFYCNVGESVNWQLTLDPHNLVRIVPLSLNRTKENLSFSYVHAVASRLGFSCQKDDSDEDGVDLKIKAQGDVVSNPLSPYPEINVQLKSTTVNQVGIRNGNIFYALDVKNYNELIMETAVKRILILYLLPEDEQTWLEHTNDCLINRKCAYWKSFVGEISSDNVSTKTVDIPLCNVFSPDNLLEIMKKISMKEALN
jgi:hypothetical protein